MTFNGTGIDDLQKILQQFPRDFTIEDVATYFEWSTTRARQAIVNGQQTDTVRVVQEIRSPRGGTHYAVYENTTWRKEWLKRAWRKDESINQSSQEV